MTKRLGGHDESPQSLLNRAYDKTLNVLRYMAFGTSDGTDAVALKVQSDGKIMAQVSGNIGVSATVPAAISAHIVSSNLTVALSKDSDNLVASLSAGTNLVGKVSALPVGTQIVDLGANNDVSLNAGTNTVGKVSALPVGTYTVDLGANNDVSLNAGTNAVGKVSATIVADLALDKGTDNISAALSAGTNLVGKVSALPVGTQTVDLGANNDVTLNAGTAWAAKVSGHIINTSDIGGGQQLADTNASTNASGNMMMGRDTSGATARFAAVDGDGHVQVDVLSGGGGGTQFVDGVAISATDTAIAIVGKSATGSAQFMGVDDDGHVQVDVLSGGGGGTQHVEGAAYSSTDTAIGIWAKDTAGASARLLESTGNNLNVNAVLSAGTNLVGKVSALPVGTQTVDLGANNDVSLNAGTNAVGKVSATIVADLDLAKANDDVTAALSAGTNLVGKVSALPVGTQTVDLGANNDVSLNAGTNNVGKVTAVLYNRSEGTEIKADSDGLYVHPSATGIWRRTNGSIRVNGETTIRTIKVSAFTHDAAGSAQVIAASANTIIRVVDIDMTIAASGAVGWKGGTSEIFPQQYFPKNSGKEHNYDPSFMCETAAGSSLFINTSAAVSARGSIGFVKY